MDDVLNARAWLIARRPTSSSFGIQVLTLEDAVLAPFRPAIETWLDKHKVDAVLVRPDRYVFGAGEPEALLAAWNRMLAPLSQAA